MKISQRIALAESLQITEEQMMMLAGDKNWGVRCHLASNPSLVEKLQNKLAEDEDVIARGNLATNPSLTEKVQEKLTEDEEVYVRSNLASNPSLVEKLQDKLARDEEWGVRGNLATNPTLCLKPAILLYFDKTYEIVHFLKKGNAKLYDKIKKLEQSVLQKNEMWFVELASGGRQREVTRKLILREVCGP